MCSGFGETHHRSNSQLDVQPGANEESGPLQLVSPSLGCWRIIETSSVRSVEVWDNYRWDTLVCQKQITLFYKFSKIYRYIEYISIYIFFSYR